MKHHSLFLYPDLIPPTGGGSFTIRNYFSWEDALRGHPLSPNATLEPTASNGSPLFALIGVPFYIIADSIHYSTVKFTSYFVNSLILATMCTVVFAFGSEFYRSKKIGFTLSLIAGVGSFAWPYVSTYSEMPLSALILVSCLYFLFIASKNSKQSKFTMFSAVLAGLFLGLQSLSHPGTLVLVPGLLLIGAFTLRRHRAKLIRFLTTFLLVFTLQLYLNEFRFGSITDFGYGLAEKPARHTSIEGLYGLIISPGNGLLVCFPLTALLPLAFYYLWGQNKIFCVAFLYVFLSIWMFYGTFPNIPDWLGGGWGPRYLVTTVPILCLALGSILSSLSSKVKPTEESGLAGPKMRSSSFSISSLALRKALKVIFISLAVAGFVVSSFGVLVWYMLGTVSYGFGYLKVGKLPDPTHQGRSEYFAWYPQYSPIVLHWRVLTTDWWSKVTSPSNPTFYGWIPCMPDNFLYCNFGIVPLVAMFVAISSIGFTIMITFLNVRAYVRSR